MEQLNFILKNWAELPRQGSEAWFESRRTRIGGSEMAAAIGKSPYQTRHDLVVRKKERKRLRAAACTFGRIFEPVAKTFVEKELGVTVHEVGAIPATRVPVCYSPDGLMVVDEKLKLLEIKCPFRRSRLNIVPDHYLCQVQTGMSVLPCDEAFFYQFRFRACTLAQLGGSVKYNRWLHTESYKRCPEKKPIAFGWIYFRGEFELQDLGKLCKEKQDELCCVDGIEGNIHHGKPGPDDIPPAGWVLPWKLFEINKTVVPRDPCFIDKNYELIWDIHKKLSKP